jgi:hypothetical protein
LVLLRKKPRSATLRLADQVYKAGLKRTWDTGMGKGRQQAAAMIAPRAMDVDDFSTFRWHATNTSGHYAFLSPSI